jgi:hypothetical protein
MTTTTPQTVVEPGFGTLEIFPLEPTEATLYQLFTELFRDHWNEFVFGSFVQGAAFEIKAPNAPTRVSLNNGYLTVDFGAWHFHICIGEYQGSPQNPIDPEVARQRRTARAEFYRRLNPDGSVGSWGIRLFNGKGEQQITIFLPNPFYSDEMKRLETPDWSRLALWDDLRRRYLGLEPDPKDRSATTLRHA